MTDQAPTLTADSPAKINLTLRVTGRRPDGFHELESLVTQINLCDIVSVTPGADDRITLTCDAPGIPSDATNLAVRAAEALRAATGARAGAHIALRKRIPAGAGLGGGSSNAATTLRLLNELWKTGLSPAALSEVAAQVGSDVPLFLHGPQVVMRGRGERVEELAHHIALWAALLLPELHCATPAVYAAWDRLATHPPRPALADVLAGAGSAARLMDLLFNDLEEAALAVEPKLADLTRHVQDVTGSTVRLTGSGAALFRLFDDAQAAARFALRVGMETAVRTDIVALRTR